MKLIGRFHHHIHHTAAKFCILRGMNHRIYQSISHLCERTKKITKFVNMKDVLEKLCVYLIEMMFVVFHWAIKC